jgi:hypothetical protein
VDGRDVESAPEQRERATNIATAVSGRTTKISKA